VFDFKRHVLVAALSSFKEVFYGKRQTKRQPKLPFVFGHSQQQLHAVFLAEFLNAASGIHDLLLAGIERVALRTYFDVQVLTVGGAGLELIAATAGNGNFVVIRMNVGFHSDVLKLGAVAESWRLSSKFKYFSTIRDALRQRTRHCSWWT
jgi:hypothetical protein